MREQVLPPTFGKRRILALIAALLVGTAAALFGLGTRTAETQTTPPAQTTYDVQDLGSLGGNSALALDVNDSGQVVGGSQNSSGVNHAFLYENGQMNDLGALDDDSNYSGANSINDSGQVVGFSYTGSNSSGPSRAFLYENGQMNDLGTLSGGNQSYGFSINDSGQVVGYASTSSNFYRAFLYENGQMNDLGTLGDDSNDSFARGINDSGQVVGSSTIRGAYGPEHAFLYKNGQMNDLGTLSGGDHGYAWKINGSGQVVGWAFTSSNYSTYRAFLYENGQMNDLGALDSSGNSFASDINDSGQVVGYSESSEVKRAFLYEDGQMTDLNTLIPQDTGWTITQARAINSDGQIAAFGSKDGAGNYALLLTPNTPADTTAPTTTATPSPTPNAAGWNNSDVTVALSATDNEGGQGVKEITYSLNGGAPTTVQGDTAQASVNTEGETTITYFAKDEADNTEAEKTLTVKLDKTAPSGSVLINGGARTTKNSTVQLTLSATDTEGGSGIGLMRFSNDGTSWSQWEPYATTKSWTLAGGKGTRTVYAEFKDQADNTVAASDTIRKIR